MSGSDQSVTCGTIRIAQSLEHHHATLQNKAQNESTEKSVHRAQIGTKIAHRRRLHSFAGGPDA